MKTSSIQLTILMEAWNPKSVECTMMAETPVVTVADKVVPEVVAEDQADMALLMTSTWKIEKSTPNLLLRRIARELNDFIEDLEDMAKDVVKGMSPEEKQVWKIKLNKLTSM